MEKVDVAGRQQRLALFSRGVCLINRIWILSLALLAGASSQALTFRLGGDEVVGNTLELAARDEDTFVSLGHHYGLGYRELINANPGVNPWVPGAGTTINLPLAFVLPIEGQSGQENIILNLAEFRLYHFVPDKNLVKAYAVGIGKQGWQTPAGDTSVIGVVHQPSWTPPESIRREQAARGISLPSVVPPGPNNPLGEYAVRLSLPGYLFHGSNQTLGVGMRVSHGCVRLYNEDIEELATGVSPGVPVQIINAPVKAGWQNDRLLLEVHPQLEDHDTEVDVEQIIADALSRKPEYAVTIDWEKVDAVLRSQNGMPQNITTMVEKN